MSFSISSFCALLATLLLTSCGSFIEVQHNPFELEADAIRNYKQKRKNRPDKTELAQQAKRPKTKPAPSRQQYFGREENWKPSDSLFPKNKAQIITDSEPRPPDPEQSPLSPQSVQTPAPLPQHKPITTGKICYTCNGKGYVFSPGTGKGTLCEKCNGRGK